MITLQYKKIILISMEIQKSVTLDKNIWLIIFKYTKKSDMITFHETCCLLKEENESDVHGNLHKALIIYFSNYKKWRYYHNILEDKSILKRANYFNNVQNISI